MDNQTLANNIGATLRAAERSVQAGNMGQAIVNLATLHSNLGQAFVAFNAVAQKAGVDALDWGAIATDAPAKGGFHTNSGGTPKGPPKPTGE